MTRYAALLRGVNVGGNRKLPMSVLRGVLEGLGHTDVGTYLQSGNAVFTASGRTTEATLARALEERLVAEAGIETTVMLRTAGELRDLVAANPYAVAAAADPKKVHAFFLAEPLDPTRLDALDLPGFAPDEVRVGPRSLYLHVPDGLGRSRLAALLTDRRLGVQTTARNWRTVEALVGLTG